MIAQTDSIRIAKAVERVAVLDDPTTGPHVSKMTADWDGN